MYYDYILMFDRTLIKRSEINLFHNSVYAGFVRPETVEKSFNEYYNTAVEMAENVSWDSVILYAILEYDQNHRTIISANFMTLEISYGLYISTVRKLWNNCRLFFVRGRKEYYCE